MKNITKYTLRETSHRFLFEQDEEAGDDAAAEIFGDDAGDDEGGDEGGDEEAPAEDEAKEEEKEEEEEEVKVSPVEKYELSDSIDQELNALFVDFEQEARKSAVVNRPDSLEETVYRRLFESAAEDIDLRDFAGNVARLVKNYQNLIDWESVILNKAQSFVNNHYGEDTARVLFDILEAEYGIVKKVKEEEPAEAPIAVGARGEGGG